MRVSTDPKDPAYIDARPRKAWLNDRLIDNWVIADEFRRCIITADGKVHNGAVMVERLPAPDAPNSDADAGSGDAAAATPANAGFSGVFVVTPDAKPAAQESAPQAPAAKSVKKAGAKRRRK